jgi:hypothetical protein
MNLSTSQRDAPSTSFDVADLTALFSRPQADTSYNTLFSRCVLDFRHLHCEQKFSLMRAEDGTFTGAFSIPGRFQRCHLIIAGFE